MRAFHLFPQGFVVAQGIEVVLVESATSVMIETVVGCSLTKVALDGGNTLAHESLNLLLIPLNGLRIGEVEDGILVGHATTGIAHMQVAVDNLAEEAVLGRKVRQLPQTGVKAVLGELLQHTHRVREAVLGKLVVTLPVDTKPARIEVDDVSRYLVLAQLTGNVESLLLRKIGDAAHPRAKGPQGQHGRTARQGGVFIQYFLG